MHPGSQDSDYDLVIICADGAADEVRCRYPFRYDPHIDCIVHTLSEFRDYASPGSHSSWDRYSFSQLQVRFDSSGEVQTLIDEKGSLAPGERVPLLREELDSYINSVYRSIKRSSRGDHLGARLEAAQSIPHLLAVLFGLEGRLAPFPGYLEREVELYPLGKLPISPEELLLKIDSLLTTGDVGIQQSLLGMLEPICRAEGLGEVIAGWGDDYRWILSYREETTLPPRRSNQARLCPSGSEMREWSEVMKAISPLVEYYQGRHDEAARLQEGAGRLEFVRTVELLERYLPQPPSTVIDIGGGPGAYSAWLASNGFAVDLVDVVPAHVEAAAATGARTARIGDARALEAADESYDAALLLGPLYHLPEKSDRNSALAETRRVVRSGGLIAVAFVSRSSVFLDGFARGWADDPGALEVMNRIAMLGRSDHGGKGFSAISCFHLPSEARSELEAAGLKVIGLFGIEGPSWIAPDFDERWSRTEGRRTMLEIARSCEANPELQGLSGHLLGVCRNE